MNVATMRMPKAQARRMLRDYRKRILKSRNDELEAVAEGLKWMARGRAVLNLSEAIRGGGFFPSGLPKLAICRSDMRAVSISWHGNQRIAIYEAVRDRWGGRRPGRLRVEIDMGEGHKKTHMESWGNAWTTLTGQTMVPMVPPAALAEAHTGTTALGKFYTLWEVERWEPVPPRDPMLLKHLGGELYVVLAEWDLTELERAVIAGTRRR